MPKINAERLIGDLKRLRQFGAKPPGVVRPAFSEADMQARNWLKDQYTEAGLEASIDGIGNVLGRSADCLNGSRSITQDLDFLTGPGHFRCRRWMLRVPPQCIDL